MLFTQPCIITAIQILLHRDHCNFTRAALWDPSCAPCGTVVSLYKSATKPQCRCCFISIGNFVICILVTAVEESLNDVKMLRLAVTAIVLLAGNVLTPRSFFNRFSPTPLSFRQPVARFSKNRRKNLGKT